MPQLQRVTQLQLPQVARLDRVGAPGTVEGVPGTVEGVLAPSRGGCEELVPQQPRIPTQAAAALEKLLK